MISLLHQTVHLNSKIFLETQLPCLQRYRLQIHLWFPNSQFNHIFPPRHLSLQLLAHRLLLTLLPQHLLLKHLKQWHQIHMQFLRLLPRLLIRKHLILQQPTHLQFLRLSPHHMLLHRCPNLQHPVCRQASQTFSCNQHQGLVSIACLGFLPRMEHHPTFRHRLLNSLLPQINKYLSQASSHKLAHQLHSQL
uniref:Uncharacterized protein n=1 Tax=Arundo donax TaxID=35708 RepID=A0A0A9DG21_ARUDO